MPIEACAEAYFVNEQICVYLHGARAGIRSQRTIEAAGTARQLPSPWQLAPADGASFAVGGQPSTRHWREFLFIHASSITNSSVWECGSVAASNYEKCFATAQSIQTFGSWNLTERGNMFLFLYWV